MQFWVHKLSLSGPMLSSIWQLLNMICPGTFKTDQTSSYDTAFVSILSLGVLRKLDEMSKETGWPKEQSPPRCARHLATAKYHPGTKLVVANLFLNITFS